MHRDALVSSSQHKPCFYVDLTTCQCGLGKYGSNPLMWHVRMWKSHTVTQSPEPNSAADLVSLLFSPGFCGIVLESCTSQALVPKMLESTGAQRITKQDLIRKQRRCYWLVSHKYLWIKSVHTQTSHVSIIIFFLLFGQNTLLLWLCGRTYLTCRVPV